VKALTYIDGVREIKTIVSGRFMRGTDPIKSTWVYPKLISNILSSTKY
jgi:uncharacterized protein (DUF1015 family)